MPRYIGLIYCNLCGAEHGAYKRKDGFAWFECKGKRKPLKRGMKRKEVKWID